MVPARRQQLGLYVCTATGTEALWIDSNDRTDPARGIKCAGVPAHGIYRAVKALRWVKRVAELVEL